MIEINKIIAQFSFLKGLEYKVVLFNKSYSSLAAAIVGANLPYKPGVYLVYNYSEDKLGELLYVGKSGADKVGNINTHQLPKRLLAVCYPPLRYSDKLSHPPKHHSRNDAWPMMMEQDGINSIMIFCFFSKINEHYMVESESNPLTLESKINDLLEVKPLWAK